MLLLYSLYNNIRRFFKLTLAFHIYKKGTYFESFFMKCPKGVFIFYHAVLPISCFLDTAKHLQQNDQRKI